MPWQPAKFKGKDVWIQVGADGAPALKGGRVPMRYSKSEGAKLYGAGMANVSVFPGPALDLPDGISADAAGKGKGRGRGSGFGKAGTRTAAQAAAAKAAGGELIASFSDDVAVCFTDGACKGNPGPAGAGAVVKLPDGTVLERHAALGRATNNIGELAAIGLALDLLEEAGFATDVFAEICTDSKYSHGVLVKGWKAKANTELIMELRGRLKQRKHRIHWIAGHVGIAENERADALANLGVDESRRRF